MLLSLVACSQFSRHAYLLRFRDQLCLIHLSNTAPNRFFYLDVTTNTLCALFDTVAGSESDSELYDKVVYCDLCHLKLTSDNAEAHLTEMKHATASLYEIPKLNNSKQDNKVGKVPITPLSTIFV